MGELEMKRILFLIVSLGLIGVTRAYEDEFLTIVGDESVRTNWVGNRVVYVFTNTASAVSATFKQKMTLEEALVVGGGGAGGGFHGAGGGGGGVLDLTARTFCPESAQISLTVGKGGASNGNGVGNSGSPSSVTIGGVTSTAHGGGGGGCGTSALPSTGSNGSGGGAGCPSGSGAASVFANAEEYTIGQGQPGGNNPGYARAGGGGGYSERGHDGAAFSVDGDKSVTGICGDGGEGLTNAITGVDVVYGSGGGGGGGTSSFGTTWAGKGGTNAGDGGAGRLSQNPDAGSDLGTVDGHAAPAGFGGGGGGGGACKEGSYSGVAQRRNGGAGGSGTVILSFTVGGEPGKPVVAQENVSFTFPDNESQPYFNIALTGAEGAAYSAVVKVYCGTGALAQAGEVYQSTNSFTGIANGESVEGFAFVYPQPGETFFVKIVASAVAVEDMVFTTSVTVPSDCRVPFHVGKGGGAGVIHVRPGARGLGTGANWTDAYADFRSALKELSEERPELWFCGDESANSMMAIGISPGVEAAIRGGFAGSESAPGERTRGMKSRIDGETAYNCLTVNNAQELTVDGFLFTRGKARGLTKSGVGDIMVTNCTFDANGAVTQKVSGRAMNLQGTAGVTHAVIADCRVVNHIETGSDASKNGGAIYLGKLADATVSDCQFASNGVAYGTTPYRGDAAGRHSYWGGALAVQDVPVTVERCDFRGNQMPTSNISEGHAGGIVVLRGACGGSVLRNCVWAGNQNQHEQLATTYMSKKSGALVVDLADPAATARVENCTFVRNLFEGLDGTAGLNVCAGTVLVKDSIFHGNVCCANNASNTVDILVRAGATANVAYTMVDSRADSRCDEGGTLDLGIGVCEDDPQFVTSFADLGAHITSNGTQRIFTSANQGKLVAFDCHVRPKSPAIDAGNPKSPYRNEPRPCGWRVNLGAYGNTPEAMTSPLGLLLMVR